MFLLKILLYVSLYPWKFLPFSNHKLFLQIASFSSLKDSVASLLGEADRKLISSLGSEQIPLKKDKREKTPIFL